MIVAARAGYSEAQERLRGGVDLLIHHVVNHLDPILLGQRFGAERQEAGRDDAAPALFRSCGRQQVSCDLLHDETVERQVVVEGLYDVVAITPGVRINMVLIHAGGIGEAGDVKPVTAPPLAVLRRGEQTVHHLGEGIGCVVDSEIAAISSVVGGRPVRSYVTRRSNVSFEAGWAG